MTLAVVKLRSPHPPHEEVLTLEGATSISYGRMLSRKNTARFLLSRADVNLTAFGHLLHPDGPPPMYTIERPDGLHSFVGFLTDYDAEQQDPYAEFVLADHFWRLENATTQKRGRVTASAGQLVVDTLAEINARGEPALYLDLDGIEGGAAVTWNYQLDEGMSFLSGVARSSGREFMLSHEIDPAFVRTRLLFREFIGRDRRGEVVLEEGSAIARAKYHIDYSKGIATGIAVGGTGSIADRIAESAAAKSQDGISATVPRTVERRGLGGTRTLIQQQVTNPEALRAAAQRLHEAPEHAVETLGFDLVEDNVDMALFDVGDICTVRLVTTDLGMALERPVRVLGINYNPESGVHRVTPQVLRA